MKLLVINPVGHTTWDEQDKRIYESFAPKDTQVAVVSLLKGPPSVETSKAHREVIPMVIEKAKIMSQDFDAVAVNCFLDPGVDPLKKILGKPVIGPCEASLAIASLLASRIGVVTVHGKALQMVRRRVREIDHHRKVKSVASIPMGVLDLNEDLDQAGKKVINKSEELKVDHDVGAICLGCTGLAGLAAIVQQAVGIPVIDPVGATVEMSLAAVNLNVFSSRARDRQSEQKALA